MSRDFLAGYTVEQIHAAYRVIPGWLGILDRAGLPLSRIEALDAYAERYEAAERQMERDYDAYWRTGEGAERLAEYVRELMPPTKGRVSEDQVLRARRAPLSRVVEVDKRGYAFCPLNKHSTRKLKANTAYGWCFACSEGIDAIGYLMRFRGASFSAAVQELAR